MDFPKIAVLYRLKNEERWIQKSLDAASQISENIVILDDGSTDNTLEICKNHPNVVEIHEQKNLPFDDTRDKNKLFEMAKKCDPEFILSLDGDQILEFNAKNILFEELEVLYPDEDVFEFEQFLMWDNPNQFRYDGIFSTSWIPKLVRMAKQPTDLEYEGTHHPGNAHCPHLPQKTVGFSHSIRCKLKIFHYGYYDEPLRLAKYKFYMETQPSPVEFDNYKHMLSGSGSKFSGPRGLEFRTLPKGHYVEDIQ